MILLPSTTTISASSPPVLQHSVHFVAVLHNLCHHTTRMSTAHCVSLTTLFNSSSTLPHTRLVSERNCSILLIQGCLRDLNVYNSMEGVGLCCPSALPQLASYYNFHYGIALLASAS